MECDLFIYNAKILTADGIIRGADTIAIKGNAITAVGKHQELEEWAGEHSLRIDLEGRVVTPGLWDAHIHLYHWSRARRHLNFKGCRDADEVLELVAGSQDEWVVGWHLHSAHWSDDSRLTRQRLDEVCKERPVTLWWSDLHSAIANTCALEKAGLMRPFPEVVGGVVEVDDEGMPTGVLRELAANLVRDLIPEPSPTELRQMIEEGIAELNSIGITGVSEQRIKDLNEGASVFRALRELECDGRLYLRVACNVAAHHLDEVERLGITTGYGTDRLRIGHLKVFSDGSLGSKTARMTEPLVGETQRGIYLTPKEEMKEIFCRASDLGMSVSVHSIGDESCRVCLDLFEMLLDKGYPQPLVPHRLEHAQFLLDSDLERFAKLGVVASVQPGHALDDREIAERYLGDRVRLGYRFGELQRSGAMMAFGSDGPVSEIDPRYGIQSAVHRGLIGEEPWDPKQRLTISEALSGYTRGAAHAAGWSGECAEIKEGCFADLVVWNHGFESMENYRDASVSLTISGGEIVYGTPESL